MIWSSCCRMLSVKGCIVDGYNGISCQTVVRCETQALRIDPRKHRGILSHSQIMELLRLSRRDVAILAAIAAFET